MVEIDTLVVGAGPQSLTVLARWVCQQPERVGRVLAVDPAGSWLRVWGAQFDRQRIDLLRSPGVHHPDPDEMALLRQHADMDAAAPPLGQPDARGEEQRCCGPLRRPATPVFAEFCDDLLKRTGLDQRVRSGSVVELVASSTGWTAHLHDGSTVRARQVLWAANPRRLVVPSGVVLGGPVAHGADVDLAAAAPGERIAVLGGGQTAGQLALGAARAGADVVLVSRAPTCVADLDVDAGWLMDDHLTPFRSIGDPHERRRVVDGVRRGSMTSDLVDGLRGSSVRWCAGVGELAARPDGDGDGATVRFAEVSLDVDRVWVATGSVPDLRADRALASLAAGGAPHVDGWPVLNEQLEWVDGLFVIGALAALTLGPAAGNLGGARTAAECLADMAP